MPGLWDTYKKLWRGKGKAPHTAAGNGKPRPAAGGRQEGEESQAGGDGSSFRGPGIVSVDVATGKPLLCAAALAALLQVRVEGDRLRRARRELDPYPYTPSPGRPLAPNTTPNHESLPHNFIRHSKTFLISCPFPMPRVRP